MAFLKPQEPLILTSTRSFWGVCIYVCSLALPWWCFCWPKLGNCVLQAVQLQTAWIRIKSLAVGEQLLVDDCSKILSYRQQNLPALKTGSLLLDYDRFVWRCCKWSVFHHYRNLSILSRFSSATHVEIHRIDGQGEITANPKHHSQSVSAPSQTLLQ